MSRKDRFHQAVKWALEKDGWTITHDPLPLNIGLLRLAVDLLQQYPINLIVYAPEQEEITEWIT